MTETYQSPAKGVNPALEQWAGSGLRPVTLPSGTELRIRLVPIEQLVKKGLVPSELTSIAIAATLGGIKTNELDNDGMKDFLKLIDVLICQMIRDVKMGEEWVPLTLTPTMLDEFDLPGDDLEQLGLIAIRKASPEIVSIESKIARGLMPADEAEGAREEASAASDNSSSFSRFHSGPGVPPDSSDGADVRTTPLGDARDQGRGRRPRSRSGGSRPSSSGFSSSK